MGAVLQDILSRRYLSANDANPVLQLTQNGAGSALTTVTGAIVVGHQQAINARNSADGDYFTIGARDSDTDAIVEIARVFGAADPYFSMGGTQQFKFYNSGVADLGGSIRFTATNLAISAPSINDSYNYFTALDTGVGQAEVARFSGGADPFWAMGGSQQFKFYNSGVADFGSIQSDVTVGLGANDTNSPYIIFTADNSGTNETAAIRLNYGIDPYLVFEVSVSSASPARVDAMYLKDTVLAFVDNFSLATNTADDDLFTIKAVENVGNTLVEVARVAGAATPYFSLGGSQEFKFYNGGTADFLGTLTMSAAAATNGQTNDAPLFTLRNYYDSDPTAGVTSTAWDLSLLHDMTAGGATPASSGICKINNVTVLTLINTNGTPSAAFPGRVTLIAAATADDPSLPHQLFIASAESYDASPVAGISFSNKYNGSGTQAGMGGIKVGKENITDGNYASYLSLLSRPAGGAVTEAVRVNSSGILNAYLGSALTGTTSFVNVDEGRTGALNIKSVQQVVALSGAQTSTTINIPSGAMLLGALFNVNTAVVTSGATNTWDADYTGGSTTNLVAAGAAGAQNTKANKLIVPEIASAQTNIEFDAPGAETFSSGAIEVVAYYIDQTNLANA